MLQSQRFISAILTVGLLTPIFCSAQFPKLVHQQPFESGIIDIHRSLDGDYFIIEEGPVIHKYSIYDQISLLRLGEISLDFTCASPGAGKLLMLENHEFLVSAYQEIYKCDPINSEKRKIFHHIEYPEYVLEFCFFNDSKDKLLIATKIYPERDTDFSFTTNKGRLLIFDIANKHIEKSIYVNYESTCLTAAEGHYWIGDNKGCLHKINQNLEEVSRCEVTSLPILKIEPIDPYQLVVVPFSSKDYTYRRGSGELYWINLATSKITKHLLESEKPQIESQFFGQKSPFYIGPSNLINDLLLDKNKKQLYLNYGFTKIDVLSLIDFCLIETLECKEYQNITCINFNRDSTQILFAFGEVSLFENSNQIAYFDLKKGKTIYTLPMLTSSIQRDQFSFGYDQSDNYYFASKDNNNYYNNDTVHIYTNLGLDKKILICKNCNVKLSAGNTEFSAFNGNRWCTFTFDTHKFKTDTVRLNIHELDSDLKETTSAKGILVNDFFDTGSLNIDGFITDYIPSQTGVFMGLESVKSYFSNSKAEFLIIDNQYNIVFKKPKIYNTYFQAKFSPTDQYVAYVDGLYKDYIVVKETGKFKTVYKYHTKKNEDIQDFCFDINNDNLYFNTYYEGRTQEFNFYKIELKNNAKVSLLHDSLFAFNFLVNEASEQLFYENYDSTFLVNLHTLKRKQKWIQNAGLPSLFYIPKIKAFGRSTDTELLLATAKGWVKFQEFNDSKISSFMDKGYYYIDKSLLPNYGFEFDNKGFNVVDFDLFYNRPDKVNEFLSLKPSLSTKLMKKVVDDRFAKAAVDGFDSDISKFFSIQPEVKIIDEDIIREVTNNQKVTLKIEAIDSIHFLQSLHILNNGVPILGNKGKPFDNNKKICRVNQDIPLLSGKNTITVYAVNKKGVRSSQKMIRIYKENENVKKNLYLICIGVNEYYHNSQGNIDLEFAIKDCRDLINIYKSNTSFNEVFVDTLFNDEVHQESVMNLKNRLLNSKAEDLVIVYMSGHGLLDEFYDFYFATANCDFINPAENGISYNQVISIFDSIPALHKMLLIDACNSGDISIQGYTKEYELMQKLFVEFSNESGQITISAVTGDNIADEKLSLKNGIFIHSILKGIRTGEADINKNNQITVSELKKFIISDVMQYSRGLQKPSVRVDNLDLDFVIW